MAIHGECSGETQQGWDGDGQPGSLRQRDFGEIRLKEMSRHGWLWGSIYGVGNLHPSRYEVSFFIGCTREKKKCQLVSEVQTLVPGLACKRSICGVNSLPR